MNTQKPSTSQQTEPPITPDTLLGAGRRWHLPLALKVADGFDERFQPTGFPNLGPALYKAMHDGAPTDYLFVESAQSLANWMEAICLDPQKPCRYNTDCAGIPYVVVQGKVNGKPEDLTSSLTEPHRLASDALIGSSTKRTPFFEQLKSWLVIKEDRPAHLPRFAKRLFYIDPGCLLHGVFLDQLDNRVRFARLLSASITAAKPETVNSGGQMRGYETLKTKDGQPNSIPYQRQDFTSEDIKLHLTLHVDSLKAMGLDDQENRFLAAFALYKIEKLLASFPRLRTACVLDPASPFNAAPNLSEAIKAAFTSDRRQKVFDGVNVDSLPKAAAAEQGFEALEVLRS